MTKSVTELETSINDINDFESASLFSCQHIYNIIRSYFNFIIFIASNIHVVEKLIFQFQT